MPTKEIIFKTSDNSFIFTYEDSFTVENILKDFLSKTESRITLDPMDISFIYKSKVINKSNYLSQKIGQLFKNERNIISVLDIDHIIGSGGN